MKKNQAINYDDVFESLNDLIIEDILDSSDEEITEYYENKNVNPNEVIKGTKAKLEAALLKHKKNRLANAKKGYLVTKERKRINLDHLSMDEIKGKLIELIQDGLGPKLTAAQREGKEITDSELRKIVEDLIYLKDEDDKS